MFCLKSHNTFHCSVGPDYDATLKNRCLLVAAPRNSLEGNRQIGDSFAMRHMNKEQQALPL